MWCTSWTEFHGVTQGVHYCSIDSQCHCQLSKCMNFSHTKMLVHWLIGSLFAFRALCRMSAALSTKPCQTPNVVSCLSNSFQWFAGSEREQDIGRMAATEAVCRGQSGVSWCQHTTAVCAGVWTGRWRRGVPTGNVYTFLCPWCSSYWSYLPDH